MITCGIIPQCWTTLRNITLGKIVGLPIVSYRSATLYWEVQPRLRLPQVKLPRVKTLRTITHGIIPHSRITLEKVKQGKITKGEIIQGINHSW